MEATQNQEFDALANEAVDDIPELTDADQVTPEAPPGIPTKEIIKPALLMVSTTLFGGLAPKEDQLDLCAQAYGDLLDYYFPDGLNGPLGLWIGAATMSYMTFAPVAAEHKRRKAAARKQAAEMPEGKSDDDEKAD